MNMHALIILTMMSLKANALIEIVSNGYTVDSDKYLSDYKMPDVNDSIKELKSKKDHILNQKININDLLDYKESEFTLGKVDNHKVDDRLKEYSFFMIGKDKNSIAWANENKEYLKKIKAYGLMAQEATRREVDNISKMLDLPFINMSLDGLSEQFQTEHYPFVLHNGWVKQ